MKTFALLLALLPVSASSAGFAFSAVNRFPVAEIGNATFEVIARGGRVGARDYWCAAGDYGISLGIPSSRRMYLVAAEGLSQASPGGKAVRFTFDPDAAGVTPIQPQVSLSVKVPGDNMTLAAARQFCIGTGLFFF
ncbi:MAG: hypothetical protein WAO69_17210 [Aestuariivita sp.]